MVAPKTLVSGLRAAPWRERRHCELSLNGERLHANLVVGVVFLAGGLVGLSLDGGATGRQRDEEFLIEIKKCNPD